MVLLVPALSNRDGKLAFCSQLLSGLFGVDWRFVFQLIAFGPFRVRLEERLRRGRGRERERERRRKKG